jgi:hypothetical protein
VDEITAHIKSSSSSRQFDLWTSGRAIASLGTNDGSPTIPFQGWHRFKEAFAPELIAKAVLESPIPVRRCFDPFGGSGTSALAAQFFGVNSETVEVNPFLADVIRAKLTRYDVDAVVSALWSVRHRSRRLSPDPRQVFARVPPTFLPPGRAGRWIFDESVAGRLAAIVSAVDSLEDVDIRRLLRVIVGGMLVDVSNVIVSGKGRRYRRGLSTSRKDWSRVDEMFASRADQAIRDITAFYDRPDVAAVVIEGDARGVKPSEPVDLCVFSPPYPNSFDYTDVYNLELWMLGYLSGSVENQTLRRSTLSSHVQVARVFEERPLGSGLLEEVSRALNEATPSLWSPWIPKMVDSYFADMMTVLGNIAPSLTEGAHVWMVVGDSRYGGVTIPVGAILCELAHYYGWKVERSDSIRHMRSSAQQGGRRELPESLIVLAR